MIIMPFLLGAKALGGKVIKAIPPKVWIALFAAAGIALYSWYWHHRGVMSERPKTVAVQKAFDQFKAGIKQAAKDAEDKAKADQKAQAAAITQAKEVLKNDFQETTARKDALIADLKSGNLKLRQQFRCSTTNASAGTSAASRGSDEAAATQLPGGLEEFLIREAERADKVVNQLTACQAVVQADRLGQSPQR